MGNNESLKLRLGYILNFDSNKIEPDKMTDETERKLFNIFSGNDNDFSANDSASLWNKLKTYAASNKNGANDTLDDSEIEQMLKEAVNTYEEEFSVAQFKEFLFKIFKKPEAVQFEDNLNLNRNFAEKNSCVEMEDYTKNEEIEPCDIVQILLTDLSTENLKLINGKNLRDVVFYYKRNSAENRDLLLEIYNNPDKEIRKEQMKILSDAIKEYAYAQNKFSDFTPEIAQKFNAMVKECLLDNASPEKIKKLNRYIGMNKHRLNLEFINEIYTDTPNGVIDKITYQGDTGDCWLLSPILSLSELPGGREYLKKFVQNNSKEQTVTVVLNGGKNEFKFSYAEIKDAFNFSIGDFDMRAIEMAYDKYAKQYQINDGQSDLTGGIMNTAFELLEGNKRQVAVIKDGKIGIEKDGKFIEINRENRELLRYIPIDIYPVDIQVLQQLEKIKDCTAITTSALVSNSSVHAYWVSDISAEGEQITVKEPHNQNNSRSYTSESYNKIYDSASIFML